MYKEVFKGIGTKNRVRRSRVKYLLKPGTMGSKLSRIYIWLVIEHKHYYNILLIKSFSFLGHTVFTIQFNPWVILYSNKTIDYIPAFSCLNIDNIAYSCNTELAVTYYINKAESSEENRVLTKMIILKKRAPKKTVVLLT